MVDLRARSPSKTNHVALTLINPLITPLVVVVRRELRSNLVAINKLARARALGALRPLCNLVCRP